MTECYASEVIVNVSQMLTQEVPITTKRLLKRGHGTRPIGITSGVKEVLRRFEREGGTTELLNGWLSAARSRSVHYTLYLFAGELNFKERVLLHWIDFATSVDEVDETSRYMNSEEGIQSTVPKVTHVQKLVFTQQEVTALARGTKAVADHKQMRGPLAADDRNFVQDLLDAVGSYAKVRVGVAAGRVDEKRDGGKKFWASNVNGVAFSVIRVLEGGGRRNYRLSFPGGDVNLTRLAHDIDALKSNDNIHELARLQRDEWEEERIRMEHTPTVTGDMSDEVRAFLVAQFVKLELKGDLACEIEEVSDGKSEHELEIARPADGQAITLVAKMTDRRLLVRVALKTHANLPKQMQSLPLSLEPPGNPLAGIVREKANALRARFLGVLKSVARADGRYHAVDLGKLLVALPQELRSSRLNVGNAVRELVKINVLAGIVDEGKERISSYAFKDGMPMQIPQADIRKLLERLSDDELVKRAEPAIKHATAYEAAKQEVASLEVKLEAARNKVAGIELEATAESFVALDLLKEKTRQAEEALKRFREALGRK